MRWQLDHLVVSTRVLAQGAADIEAALGVPLEPGGVHAEMGTWNRLLSLGPEEYLEVIAIDPAAPAPARSRWFTLDAFSGPTRLTHWACRTDSLTRAIEAAGPAVGGPVKMARGDYSWSFALPWYGRLPYGGCHPALIQWHGPHPAARLVDRGCRLKALVITHPDAAMLQAVVPVADDRVFIEHGSEPGLQACIETPGGERWLT